MEVFLVKAKYQVGKALARRIKARAREIADELRTGEGRKICLLYSIQYADFVKFVEGELRKLKFKLMKSQVTGCSDIPNADTYLYIGDGLFHPLSIVKSQLDNAFENEKSFELENKIKPVYIFNPLNLSFERLSEEEIKKQINLLKARWFNFNNATNYGIIVSIKPGQCRLEQALKIKEMLENEAKVKKGTSKAKAVKVARAARAWIFLTNNIQIEQLENFKIDFWINTACPGFSVENNVKMCSLKEFWTFWKLLREL
ncbi:MAG: diphthamide synthesis protein [Candidatus Pacearchaeota archaeon]